MDSKKIKQLKDLALILDSKKSGTESLVLLKKIQDLEQKISDLEALPRDFATQKEAEDMFSSLQSSIDELRNSDLSTQIALIKANYKKLENDSEYSTIYFKKELGTLKNTIADLKNVKPPVMPKMQVIDTEKLAVEASKRAVAECKPLIPVIPPLPDFEVEIVKNGEAVRDSLELLEGDARLSAKYIKDLPENVTKIIQNGAGGTVGGIKELVAGSGILVDNSNLQYPIISAPGSTTDEKVKLNASDPTAGYLDAKLQEGIQQIQYDTTPSTTITTPGQTQWNSQDITLDIKLDSQVTLQVGQETLVRVVNKTGGNIVDGTPVYLSGAQGNRPKVGLARGNTHITGNSIGLATEHIADNQEGFVTVRGLVRDLNTTGSPYGETWADGDTLWVSKATAGYLTNAEPSVPHHSNRVGIVVRAHATQGQILVQVSQHCTLEELSDVDGTPLTTTGQFPSWHQTGGYFDFDKNINDYVKLDQTTPQTITGGLLSYDVSHPAFTGSHQLVDKEYVDMAVTAINTNFYMLNSASGVSTYKDTQIAIPALAEANVAVSVTANLQEIQGWISPTAGTLSTMIHGIYNMYLEAKVNATVGTKRIKLYWELIERKADNSEVVIATSEDSEELTSTQGDYNIHIALVADYAITAGSRIVGKVRAKLSGLGNNPTVTIYYLGSINSRWEIPTNIEVLSGTFLQLNQTTPQTFTGGSVTGTGLLQVVGGVLGKNVMLTVSDTAPANPQMGDLWVDIS